MTGVGSVFHHVLSKGSDASERVGDGDGNGSGEGVECPRLGVGGLDGGRIAIQIPGDGRHRSAVGVDGVHRHCERAAVAGVGSTGIESQRRGRQRANAERLLHEADAALLVLHREANDLPVLRNEWRQIR